MSGQAGESNPLEEAGGVGIVTCPSCGNKTNMPIPAGMCMAFYTCPSCKKLIKAKKSCCVFCDYGDRPCPVGAHP